MCSIAPIKYYMYRLPNTCIQYHCPIHIRMYVYVPDLLINEYMIVPAVRCTLFPITLGQIIRCLGARYCLPPPPGCPKAIYALMVQCW